jgi:glucuronoarabinoxylan endo-1,4-beta-xylanase
MKRLITCVLVFVACTAVARSQEATVAVNFTDVQQRIDGFGASDAWNPPLSDAHADAFFSASTGIGLSILRVGIDSSGNDMSAYSNATKAAARGAIIWAAPWSAPAAWKDNGSEWNGGHLLPANYDAWATRLTGFAETLQEKAGVPLYGLSVQNEPDFTAAGYASMIYTNQELTNFVKVLGPKLAALNPRPKLLAPDVSSWAGAWGYTRAVLEDGAAAQYLDIIAVHQYRDMSAPQNTAKPIWQTEQSSLDPFDPNIFHGLTVARWIHDAIVIGKVSAWHYWWLTGLNADNEGLIGYNRNSRLTKRLYTVGNFSKFVRPGFVVVGVSGAPGGVSVSAYKNPATGAFVIVAINQNASDTPVTLTLNGLTTDSVTPWVTSNSLNLAQQSAVAIAGDSFTAILTASSVTSFVGRGTLIVSGVAAITSALTTSGTVGSAFAYQIMATNTPTSYDATGLPAGLALNAATGLITGTPTAVGVAMVTLSATSSSGTSTATLTLTIAPM